MIAWRRHLHLLIGALLCLGVAAAGTVLLSGSRSRGAAPAYLAAQLGPRATDAPLVRHPTHDVTVAVDERGYTVHARAGRTASVVSLASVAVAAAGPWRSHRNGVIRSTSFGSEAITTVPGKTEEFLVVDHRQGKRTWRWSLDGTLTPKLGPGGSIFLVDTRGALVGSILPVEVLTQSGKNVTPAGLHWSLAGHAGGHVLELRLDDARLPLPYTIDPAVAWSVAANGSAHTATSLTFSVTPAVVSNQLLLVSYNAENTSTSACQATSVTYNGTAMTLVPGSQVVATNPAPNYDCTALYYTLNPATGAHNVVISFGAQSEDGIVGGAETFANVWQNAAAVSTATTSQGPGLTSTAFTTTWPNQMLADSIAPGDTIATMGTWNAGAGQTYHVHADSSAPGGSDSLGMSVDLMAAPGAHTMSWTSTTAPNRSAQAVTALESVDTTGPALNSVTLSGLTGQTFASGSTLYYNAQGSNSGTFTVNSSFTDADSGVATVAYPAVAGFTGGNGTVTNASPSTSAYASASPTAYSWTSSTTTTGAQTITATNRQGGTGTGTFTLVKDTTAPTGGAFSANGTAATGGGSSSTITSGTTLTINSRTDYTETQSASAAGLASSTLTMQTGTLSGNSCSAYGAPATIVGTTSQTVSSGHCYLLTLTGTDNVANAASISTTVKVDTTAPSAPTTFAFSALTNAYFPGSGSIVYFKGGTAGGFTATASGATDADTGIASYSYGAVAGTGWANAAGAYTFTAASPTGTGAVTATNNVGLTGPSASFTAQSDTTAPAGGAFSANGTAASAGGTSSYLTSGTTLTINSRTDYTETQTATASGLATSTLTIQSATLSGNSCGAFGSASTIAGTTSQTVASGNCYLLTLTGTDNVGNATSISTTVKVDTTGPSAPTTFGFSALTNSYYPGSGSIVYFKGGSAGGFTVTASGSTDADTGVAGYNYAAIAGSGWGNAAGAYTFTAASPTGTGAVTASNNAGLAGSSASFTAQNDSTAPAGGAFTANSVAATGGGSTSYVTSGTTLTINSRTDYTEAQTATASGLASSVLTMQTGTLSGNSCSAYGAPATIVGTTSQTVSTAHCYLLTLTGTDNVGNVATVSTTVKVDTTAPSAPTGFTFSALTNSYYPGSGSIVYFKGGSAGGFTATASGAADADTGIAGYNYGAIAGSGWGNAAGAYTFTAASPTGTASVTASNGAGTTSSATTFTAQSDSTAPAGGAFTANGVAATGGGSSSTITAGTTLTINSRTDYTETQTATASGLASSTLTIQSATLSGNSCGAFGSASTISGTTSQTVASGNCYLLTLTGTDNVGNAASVSTTVKVDTTAPSAPTTFGFSALTNAYYPGAGSIVYFKGGSAGGFTATASGATDADTGIASYNYGAIAGSGWSNAAGVYSFTAASPTGTGAVTATNNVGLTGPSASFTAQSDSTAPAGGAFSANGTAATGGGSSSTITAGTTLTINSRTDYTETQTATASGLSTSTLTI
ncbi:MAG TPA: hypothetical protein VMB53_07205, partial [Gaiellaceae bacterium]|nr:hypothetical protein [Gaiellaceae bacterium]